MDKPATCGEGLAAHASSPRSMAGVAAAMAALFEAHTQALDTAEPAGRVEHAAYQSLARGYDEVARRLRDIAAEAGGYASLAPANHDMGFMTGPRPLEAFERLVAARAALRTLLEKAAASDEAMLAQMRSMRTG